MPDPHEPKSYNVWTFFLTVLIGIGLTVIAAPIFFLATCIPMGAGAFEHAGSTFLVYSGIAAAGSSIVAVLTRKQGVRWGAIVLFCLAAAVVVWFGAPLLH